MHWRTAYLIFLLVLSGCDARLDLAMRDDEPEITPFEMVVEAIREDADDPERVFVDPTGVPAAVLAEREEVLQELRIPMATPRTPNARRL